LKKTNEAAFGSLAWSLRVSEGIEQEADDTGGHGKNRFFGGANVLGAGRKGYGGDKDAHGLWGEEM